LAVDHFVPKNSNQMMSNIPENAYSNLVYSCSQCNRGKWHHWPTGDEKLHNNGTIGWVDPVGFEFASHFRRNADGTIVVTSNSTLSEYMYSKLKLNLRIHAVNWNMEKIFAASGDLSKLNDEERAKIELIREYLGFQ
jgi:hypothetical protein